MRRAGDIERLQPLIAADAVIGMDDEIAGGEARRLGEELVEACGAGAAAGEPVAEDVLLAKEDERVGARNPGRAAGSRGRWSIAAIWPGFAVGDAAQLCKAVFAQHGAEPSAEPSL